MNNYYLGIDVGGSHIVGAMVNPVNGVIDSGSVYEVKIDSGAKSFEIIRDLQNLISHFLLSYGDQIGGIGVAIPGPFDYKKGISKIEGVSKFDSLFGMNIAEEIRFVFNDRSKPLVFLNDASAFALGEFYSGAAKNSQRSIVITLGTGFGSTFLIDGEIQQAKDDGIPANGYLYDVPYKGSIADDYFSTRWFINRWYEETGDRISGVKDIVDFAEEGEYVDVALKVFNEFSSGLSEFLEYWLKTFKADTLVVGGNIAKASKYFSGYLMEDLTNRGVCDTEIQICKLWDKASIAGAAMYAFSMEKDQKQVPLWRKTEQFLAPDKTQHSRQGMYDIYPSFPLGDGKIRSGAAAFSEWIIRKKTVVIDGYIGVFWEQLVEAVSDEIKKQKKCVHWYHIDAAIRTTEEINEMIKPYLGGDDPVFGKITDLSLRDWFDDDKLSRILPDDEDAINVLVGCGARLAGWNAPLVYIDLPKNELQFRMRAGVANNLGADRLCDNRQMYKRFYFVDWRVLDKHKNEILSEIDLIVDGQRPADLLFMSGDDLRNGLDSMAHNYFRVRPWFEPGAWGGQWMKDHIDGLNKDVPNLAWSFELMVLENGLLFESDDYRLEVSFDFLMYNNYKQVLGDCAEQFKFDFPIRFDFLDTFDGGNLSVQCHPRPEYIKEKFGMPFTQDETYYILDCKEKPVVYLGFQEGIDPVEFHQALVNSQERAVELNIEQYVQKFEAQKHDLFLIPNGTIHASGKNNLVLEISSAPYIFTFKMYDWLRLDLDGRPRPINIEHGMNNLYFERQGDKVEKELICKPYILDEHVNYKLEHLPTHATQFYDIFRYSFDKEIIIETKGRCHVWMLVEGSSVMLETQNGLKQRFNYAETFVIPAATGSYKIINEGEDKVLMLKAFVK